MAIGLTACASHFEVPEPTFAPPPDVPPMERATIAIPVAISMASLHAKIDSVFPAHDSLDRAQCSAAGGLLCHQYVYNRDSLDLRMVGDRVTFFTRVSFRGRVGLPGGVGVASCGYAPETMRRAEVHFATNLYWRNDWRLASRSTAITPDILDPCQVTLLRVDVTPLMKRMMDGQLGRVRQQVDSMIPAVADLRPMADSLWRAMQRPLLMDTASGSWLAMQPDGVSLAPLTGAPDAVHTALVLTARPRVVVGSAPPAENKPLPALTLADGNGVHLPLEIEVPFSDISKRATAALAGENAGTGITVHNVDVWGAGDSAVVRVDITGKMSGALFLVGRVGYDTTSRSILIGDLNYTLASATKMSSIKAALGAGRIRRALQEASGHGRLAVGDQVDQLKAQLGVELNRELAPGVMLSGFVKDVRMDRIYAKENAFVLRVVLDADARVTVIQ